MHYLNFFYVPETMQLLLPAKRNTENNMNAKHCLVIRQQQQYGHLVLVMMMAHSMKEGEIETSFRSILTCRIDQKE